MSRSKPPVQARTGGDGILPVSDEFRAEAIAAGCPRAGVIRQNGQLIQIDDVSAWLTGKKFRALILSCIALVVLGCGPSAEVPDPTIPIGGTWVPTATSTATPTITPTVTPTSTPSPVPTSTPIPPPPPTPPPPTPEPQVAAAAEAQPASTEGRWAIGNYTSREEAREIAASVGWPASELDNLIAVIYSPGCLESDGWAVRNKGGGPYFGLLQLEGPLWFNYAGVPFSDWANAYVNLTAGLATWHYYLSRYGYGWHGWECQP